MKKYLPWCKISTGTSLCFNWRLSSVVPLFCFSRSLRSLFVSRWLPFISTMQCSESLLLYVFLLSSPFIGIFCWRLLQLFASSVLTPQSVVLQVSFPLFQSNADNFLTVFSAKPKPSFLVLPFHENFSSYWNCKIEWYPEHNRNQLLYSNIAQLVFLSFFILPVR